MGVVYEALDRETDKVVALKALTRTEASHISRFKNEFRSLADCGLKMEGEQSPLQVPSNNPAAATGMPGEKLPWRAGHQQLRYFSGLRVKTVDLPARLVC